jgi:hypothetical protein
MRLDELLALASVVRDTPWADISRVAAPPRLAKGVLELLGAGWPCGWPEPEAAGTNHIRWEALGDDLITLDDARGLLAGLARAIAEAER